MNTIDSYFEYRIPIFKGMQVGNHPFITDVRENIEVNAPNGDQYTTRWIQFKIPIQKRIMKILLSILILMQLMRLTIYDPLDS